MADKMKILLAESDRDYAEIIKIAFKEAGAPNPVEVVRSEEEAISYLSRMQVHSLPVLIVLALRLQLLNGFCLLRWIRGHPEFRSVPVFVLSGVRMEGEDRVAHKLGSNYYAVKPASFPELIKVVRLLRDRWLEPRKAC